MKETDKLWEKVVSALEGQVTAVSFDLWIKPIQAVFSDEDNILFLIASGQSAKSQLIKNHKNQIAETVAEVYGEDVSFRIIDRKEYDEIIKNAQELHNKEKVFAAEVKNPFIPKYTFENFVVGKSNQYVCAACKTVAEKPGENFNPLFIYGGVGLGKTHLLHAIGNYITEKNPQLKVQYVTCEKFTNDYIEGIRNSETMNKNFREKYRNVDVLMIDDIQFISGKTSTQEEFFHTFNDLHQLGKQVILSSDRPPKDIAVLEERLRSRFSSGLIQDIQMPDYETRVAILRKKTQQENYKIDDDVIVYIAQKTSTNIRQMEGLLSKIHFLASLIGKKSAGMEEAIEALKEQEDVRKGNITCELIITEVSDFFKISPDDIKGKSKTKEKTEPRMIAIYLICDILNLPLMTIGTYFGGRDHTTIMYARDKISLEIKTNNTLQKIIEELKNKITGF